MPLRKVSIVPGEFYHILGRGNRKQEVFKDDSDWTRFLFLILYFQSPTVLKNISRPVHQYVQNQVFNIEEAVLDKIIAERFVELVAFALMPNHFHLIVYEKEANGISRYMQRVMLSYTKHFNTKYNQVGHLFEGPFKSVHIEDDQQLLYLSAYVHRNPRELKKWVRHEHLYPWSSFQDYVKKNRWGKLLRSGIITDRYNKKEYRELVDQSGAKEDLLDNLDNLDI